MLFVYHFFQFHTLASVKFCNPLRLLFPSCCHTKTLGPALQVVTLADAVVALPIVSNKAQAKRKGRPEMKERALKSSPEADVFRTATRSTWVTTATRL